MMLHSSLQEARVLGPEVRPPWALTVHDIHYNLAAGKTAAASRQKPRTQHPLVMHKSSERPEA